MTMKLHDAVDVGAGERRRRRAPCGTPRHEPGRARCAPTRGVNSVYPTPAIAAVLIGALIRRPRRRLKRSSVQPSWSTNVGAHRAPGRGRRPAARRGTEHPATAVEVDGRDGVGHVVGERRGRARAGRRPTSRRRPSPATLDVTRRRRAAPRACWHAAGTGAVRRPVQRWTHELVADGARPSVGLGVGRAGAAAPGRRRVGHGPRNAGRRFSAKAARPFGRVVRREAVVRRCARARSAGLRRRCRCRPRARASPPWRWRRRAGSWSATSRRERQPAVEQLVVGDDAVDQSPLGGLVGGEEAAAEHQLAAPGPGRSRARQQREHAAAAHLAEVEVAVADAGRRARRARSRSSGAARDRRRR